ncbi:competence protein ComK [Ectobacillus ponti]|uniref:Competence protein ComK n=1 Tax=Ectobacillus ponti TaxID=2961894 RepID=A0AA41XA46_9BACI|nr:competence protein ComK [Ectobacillus ponti]MCP8968236.1 competence protein ComK [Ectobacillus ponti]
MKYLQLASYVIHDKTMVIIPVEHEDGKHRWSVVEEADQMFVVRQTPFEIMDSSCRYYGSSFEGRKEGTKELLQETHKLSICVDPISRLYFFPTTSYTGKECIWVSHSHVGSSAKHPHNNVRVVFTNGRKMRLPISKGSFDRQFHRAGSLRHRMEGRMDKTNGGSYHVPVTDSSPKAKVNEVINPYLIEEDPE